MIMQIKMTTVAIPCFKVIILNIIRNFLEKDKV